MPAHLDEADNHKKKAKYLAGGGTEKHILGNCAADALAKEGADLNIKDQEAYDRFVNRRALTRATQDFMVDVWRAEKAHRVQIGVDSEIFAQEEAILAEMMNHTSPPEDDEHNDFDIFAPIDCNGDDVQTIGEHTIADHNCVPTVDDNNDKMNTYLDQAYKNAFKRIGTDGHGHHAVVLSEPWTYKKRRTITYQYKKVKEPTAWHKIEKHQGGSYEWMFDNIIWSNDDITEQEELHTTFHELAILHVAAVGK